MAECRHRRSDYVQCAFYESKRSKLKTMFVITSMSLCLISVTCFAPTLPHYATRSVTILNAKKKSREISMQELVDKMMKNPSVFQPQEVKPKKKYRRTRKRVENPKQKYIYASHRKDSRNSIDDNVTVFERKKDGPIQQAREFGLINAAAQHTDPMIDDVEPEIVGELRVGDGNDETSSSTAYVILKPAGWSILGSNPKKKTSEQLKSPSEEIPKIVDDLPNDTEFTEFTNRVKVTEDDGSVDFVEFNEMDILEAMTPEERAEFELADGLDWAVHLDSDEKRREVAANKRGRMKASSFNRSIRPSIVSWLKDVMAQQGTPIRGGKYWSAVAGATNVDDSGLVLLCPKEKTRNVYVDYAKFVAVVGNGKNLTPKSKTREAEIPKELTKLEMVSKLRRGRGDDAIQAVEVTILEQFSSCTSVIQPCQNQFLDGIRGDPAANPLDRRASRRLIHCSAMSVSSLVHDDTVQLETESLPDDIRVLSDRRNHHQYTEGSFLGRNSLRDNPLTDTYREINGAADGFSGWTVDRYDKWLLVHHDEGFPKGPLPSIHDGNTAGVYYLPTRPDRSAMGSSSRIRPILLEGQAAPDVISILENGITYHVSLDRDLSTGIFLDQRPQRAWLSRNCNENTRVLNCFAHCGAFSVAAATAGASTVSLDLEQKWLNRIEPQMLANGIEYDDNHDCIYGDCFSWLSRLSKRGEQFDLVILDPPSTSTGKNKKRWSVKSDMDALVAAAAPLVKKGGLLWTSTNNGSLSHTAFSRLCKKGLDKAGIPDAKLERVVPMPADFPSLGPQQVKNLVWRLP